MGQVIFHCTNCGTKLSAGLDEVGAEFECPGCQQPQAVPGGSTQGAVQTAPGTPVTTTPAPAGIPVIHLPKRKIVLTSRHEEEEEDEEDEEIGEYEEIGGGGLALFAVALGTAGLILCGLSMIWMFIAQRQGESNWWISLMVFLATFLMGLMGLVLSQLARLVVRLADRVSRIVIEGDEE
ncbi:MAG: hypothetical protein V1873_00910 [Verrucomicrobiota bacterium]